LKGYAALYLLHVLIEQVENILFLAFLPVTFDMVIPRAPTYCKNIRVQSKDSGFLNYILHLNM